MGNRTLQTCLAFLAFAALLPGEPTPEQTKDCYHAEFEAEAFDGLSYYGNWHPEKGTGWYAKEHIHGSGQGVAICDQFNLGAEMTRKLEEPVPAGKLNAFAHVYKMRGGGKNSIELSLGKFDDGKFVSAASGLFSWDSSTKGGYIWLKQELKVPAACDTVRIRAAEITRTGIGDNPEQEYAYLFFDKVYLTDSPDIKIQSSRWRDKLTLPEKARSTFVSEAHQKAEEYQKNQTVARPLPDVGDGNLIPNSGFELGMTPWWFTPDSFQEGCNLTFRDLDAKQPFHGKYSLRMQLAPYRTAFAGTVACWPFLVKGDTEYTLSFQAKAESEGINFTTTFYRPKGGKYSTRAFNDAWRGGWKSIGSGKGGLTTRGDRHSVKVKTQAGQQLLYFEFLCSSAQQRTVWLDCFQFAEGGQAEYEPRVPVEAAICSREVAKVHYLGKPLEFVVSAFSESEAARTVNLGYEVLDLRGETRAKGEASIAVTGKGTFEERLRVPFSRRGSFVLNYESADLDGCSGQFGFCVVPDPREVPERKERPFIGVICGLDDASNTVHSRLGHDIIVTLEGSTFMPIIGKQNLKEDGSIVWRDDEVQSCFKHGMDVLGYIVPWTWGRGKKLPWLKTYRCRLSGAEVMDLDGYADYVHRVIKHYPQVKRWILEDEADQRWTAKEFAPWITRLYVEAKRANPQATVMFSMTPQMFEDAADVIGHQHNDAIGGSFHGYRRWFYGYQREVMERFKKRACWMIGVGWTSFASPSVHDLWLGFQPRNSSTLDSVVSRVVKNLGIQQAIVAPEIQCRYTSRLNWVHGWSFAADNSFLPHSVAYVNALQFLRNCEPEGIVYPDNASLVEAYALRKGGKPCVMVASQSQLGSAVISLDLEPSEVVVFDKDLNPVELAPGKVELPLPANDLYFFRPDDELNENVFLQAFGNMKVRHTVWSRTLCLPSKEGVDFGVYVRNDSEAPLEGILSAGGGNRRHPQDRMRSASLPSGTGALWRFPLKEDFSAARSLGCIGDNFSFSDGKAFFWSNSFSWKYGRGLWMSKSLPATGARKVTVDGDTGEWRGQSGSYVYMSWALDGSYGRRQGRYEAHRIREQTDASATIWSRFDDSNLYFAVRVYDNDVRLAPTLQDLPQTGDQLRLLLDTNLLGDLDSDSANGDDLELILGPGIEKGRAWHLLGDQQTEIPAGFARTKHGWDAEVAVPWNLLHGRHEVMGFDISLIDADGGLARKAELTWSGAEFARHDPRGYGQLIMVRGPID